MIQVLLKKIKNQETTTSSSPSRRTGTTTFGNGCTREPLLLVSSSSSKNQPSSLNDIQNELVDIAEDVLLTNSTLASTFPSTAASASEISPQNVTAAIIDDVKRELLVVASSNEDESNIAATSKQRSSSSLSPSSSVRRQHHSPSSTADQQQQQQQPSFYLTLPSLRSHIAAVSSSSNPTITRVSQSNSARGNNKNTKQNNKTSSTINKSSKNQDTTNILFTQTEIIEVGNGSSSAEVSLQLAPFQQLQQQQQSSSGDPPMSLFVVLRMIDEKVLLSPGGAEVDGNMVPLVVPLQGCGGGNGGLKSPRGRK